MIHPSNATTSPKRPVWPFSARCENHSSVPLAVQMPDSDKIRTIIDDVKSRYKQARGEVTFGISPTEPLTALSGSGVNQGGSTSSRR